MKFITAGISNHIKITITLRWAISQLHIILLNFICTLDACLIWLYQLIFSRILVIATIIGCC